MSILKSAVLAFAMYSKIPVPQVEWNEKNMRYMLCFFPFVGTVIGIMQNIVLHISNQIQLNTTTIAIILTILPIILTGAIHMDGYMDTCDAIGSHQSKEKKLEILKDSHVGAFAIIGLAGYLLISVALYIEIVNEIYGDTHDLILCSIYLGSLYISSRIFSAFSIVTFTCAKGSGLANMFANAADKKNVKKILMIEGTLLLIILLYLHSAAGILLLISGIVYYYYYKFSKKEFGGITGDLAGYFLQIYEITLLAAIFVLLKLHVI